MIVGTGTDLSYSYYGNNELVGQITLSQIVTANNVTDMRYMFCNCPNITSVLAYEYSAQEIGYTYSYSYKSSYIDDNIEFAYRFNYSYTYTYNSVTNFEQPKTGFVKNMSHMFANCYELTEANLAYMDFSECTDMQGMFDNCYNLQTVVFGRYACNALLHLQDIFSRCYSLDRVYVPFELKDDFSNIIGHAGLHSYFYNANYNIEDTLPKIKSTYYFDEVEEICRYTTLTVNQIGAFIVEADYDYKNANKGELKLYGSSSYDDVEHEIFTYDITSEITEDNSAIELSDIAEPFSYTFVLGDHFILNAELLLDNTSDKSITYIINNSENSRYIDMNTYLIYFSDNEDGSPDSTSRTHYETQNQAKSTIIADTDNWFFGDIKRIKCLDINTLEYTYSYESSFDTYTYVTYTDATGSHDIYGTLLTLNNELDDNYDGPQTEEAQSVDYVYVYQMNNG